MPESQFNIIPSSTLGKSCPLASIWVPTKIADSDL